MIQILQIHIKYVKGNINFAKIICIPSVFELKQELIILSSLAALLIYVSDKRRKKIFVWTFYEE